MSFGTKENPYLTEAINQFKSYYNRKVELESNFSPSVVQEYTEVISNYNNSAVELLKLGIERCLEESLIVLVIDDEEYPVQRKDILKIVGEKQWNVFFPIEELDKTPGSLDDNDYKEVEDLKGVDDRFYGYRNNYPGYPPAININPLGAFLSSFCNSLFSSMSYANPANGYPYAQTQPTPSSAPSKKDESVECNSGDLMSDFAGIQKKLILLEKERDTAQESLATAKQKYEKLKTESNEKIEHLTAESKQVLEEFHNSETKIKELTQEREKLLKEMDDEKKRFENRLSSLTHEIEMHKQEISASKKNNDELVSKLRIADESLNKVKREAEATINGLNDKIRNLEALIDSNKRKAADNLRESIEKARNEASQKSQNALRDIQNKLNEQTSKMSEYKNNMDQANRQREELQGKIKQLTDENNRLKDDIDKANKSVNTYKEQAETLKLQDTEKEEYYQQLQEESQKLKTLAYTDPKTGVMNTNAFNRDFPTCNRTDTTLAMVGIRNMKGINMLHGRGSGDAVISMVTDQLSKTFGKDNVYLILGDQYAIITHRTVRDTVYMQIDAIKRALNGQNIDIAFGVATGSESSDLSSLIGIAEERMNHMKAGNSIMNTQSAMGNNQSSGVNHNQNPSGYDNNVNRGYQMPGENTPVTQPTSIPEEVNIDGLIEEYISTKN